MPANRHSSLGDRNFTRKLFGKLASKLGGKLIQELAGKLVRKLVQELP
jgi:hypothetical protein